MEANKRYLIDVYNMIEDAQYKLIGFMDAPHLEDTRAFMLLALVNLKRAIKEVSDGTN